LTQVLTVDQFGPAATIKTGQIASLMGMPIVMTRFLSADLNNSGLFDNATTDKTAILMAHTPSWYIFERRGILVETDRRIDMGSTEIVATMRATFDTLDLDATKNVAYGYKVSAT
jgi:hypothetical protein